MARKSSEDEAYPVSASAMTGVEGEMLATIWPAWTKSFMVAMAKSGWPRREAVVAAPLSNSQKMSKHTRNSLPLVETGEASLEGAAGRDTVTDTGGGDDARACEHLAQTRAGIVRELALKVVLGVEAGVAVDAVDDPVVLGRGDLGGGLCDLGRVDFDTGHCVGVRLEKTGEKLEKMGADD